MVISTIKFILYQRCKKLFLLQVSSSSQEMFFKGCSIIIPYNHTGCTGNGIGFNLAKQFYEAGCKVFMSVSCIFITLFFTEYLTLPIKQGRTPSKFVHIADDVENVIMDVCDEASVDSAIEEVEKKAGKIGR